MLGGGGSRFVWRLTCSGSEAVVGGEGASGGGAEAGVVEGATDGVADENFV